METRTSKGSVASITKHYISDVSFADVKAFYIKALEGTGWMLSDEESVRDWGRDLGGRELRFDKSEYYVTVFYYGERSGDGSEYAIGITWRK